MPLDISRPATPEERELEKKQCEFTALEMDLVQNELELATLQARMRAFQARYLNRLGSLFVELDSLEARVAEQNAWRAPADPNAREWATQARERSHRSAEEAEASRCNPVRGKFTPTEDLKKIYRNIALRVHPDLAANEADAARRTLVMSEVNEAYGNGDESRLMVLLQEWESSPEAIVGDEPGARLVRVIRQISQVQNRVVATRAELEKLKGSEAFQLQLRVEEAEAIGRDLLAEMASHLDDQIRKARDRAE